VTLKRLTGLPLVLDFRDPWARTQWKNVGGHSTRQGIQRRLERWCVRHADRVILNTSNLRDDFVEAYGEQQLDKFVMLPNGYDPALVTRAEEIRTATNSANAIGVVRLCHPGQIYGQRDLKPLIDAIAQLSRSGRHVILDQIGNVDAAEQLIEYAERLRIQKRIVFHGYLPHGEVLRIMAAASIFVLNQPGTSLQIPGKLFEMLPFRRPILALADPEGATAQIIDRYALGAVVPNSDHDAIARAILRLAGARAECLLQEGWQQAMSVFDGRAIAYELGQHFNTCMAPSPRGQRGAVQIPINAPASESSVNYS
jgi:glycosyltransferase involved in cell wall biosynthesis